MDEFFHSLIGRQGEQLLFVLSSAHRLLVLLCCDTKCLVQGHSAKNTVPSSPDLWNLPCLAWFACPQQLTISCCLSKDFLKTRTIIYSEFWMQDSWRKQANMDFFPFLLFLGPCLFYHYMYCFLKRLFYRNNFIY